MPYRLRNATADHRRVDKAPDDYNETLAENFKRLAAGRSFGLLRRQMADAGVPIGMGTLHRVAQGDMGTRGVTLEKVAQFFGVSADQMLQPELGAVTDGEFVDVARVSVALSAGRGSQPHLEETVGSLKFRASFLRSVGASPSSAKIVDVAGRSMEPTIPDGAVILVNAANREPRDRQVYALRVDGELFIKRLIRTGDSWVARSDNEDRDEYPDIKLDTTDAEVIGRAVWMGAKL